MMTEDMSKCVAFVSAKMKRSLGWRIEWEPQPDITTYELALCVPLFTAEPRLAPDTYDSLPPEAQRHFVVSE